MKRYLAGVFAISEIFAILIAGSVLGGLTAQFILGELGFDIASIDELEMIANPDYDAALIAAVMIVSRFFWLLLIAFLVLRFVHGVTPRAVGVSRGGHSWPALIGAGVLTFAVGSLPWKLVLLANEYHHFGEGLEGWAYFSGQSITFAYILFALASLVLLPPLFEEPFARGYMRVRLAKAFAPIGGVILAAILFLGSHGHFYESDPVVLLSFPALIFAAICWTWSAYRMNSIIPPFIAHALTNFPLPVEMDYLLPSVIAMAVILVVGASVLFRELAAFFSEWREAPKGLILFGVLLIAAFLAPIIFFNNLAPVLGLAALVLMIIGWLPPMRRWGAG